MQVCNCNGVSKAAIAACVAGGKRSAQGVMDATRAGKGCGSCKSLVAELVDWLCGGEVEEDPVGALLRAGDPARARPSSSRRSASKELKSVSAVFRALAGGVEDAGSKPALASLLSTIWAGEYEDERDARFINDRVHANIQKDGTFSVDSANAGRRVHARRAAAHRRRRRSSTTCRWSRSPAASASICVGIAKDDLPGVWRDLGMPAGYA